MTNVKLCQIEWLLCKTCWTEKILQNHAVKNLYNYFIALENYSTSKINNLPYKLYHLNLLFYAFLILKSTDEASTFFWLVGDAPHVIWGYVSCSCLNYLNSFNFKSHLFEVSAETEKLRLHVSCFLIFFYSYFYVYLLSNLPGTLIFVFLFAHTHTYIIAHWRKTLQIDVLHNGICLIRSNN